MENWKEKYVHSGINIKVNEYRSNLFNILYILAFIHSFIYVHLMEYRLSIETIKQLNCVWHCCILLLHL